MILYAAAKGLTSGYFVVISKDYNVPKTFLQHSKHELSPFLGHNNHVKFCSIRTIPLTLQYTL